MQLNLSCSTLSCLAQHALRRVTVHSDAMRKVAWRGCVGLDQMLLACGYLQEVIAPTAYVMSLLQSLGAVSGPPYPCL